MLGVTGGVASGKTTVALSTIANCQRGGGMAAFVDAEHALDPVYAKALGVDVDELDHDLDLLGHLVELRHQLLGAVDVLRDVLDDEGVRPLVGLHRLPGRPRRVLGRRGRRRGPPPAGDRATEAAPFPPVAA